MSENMLPYLQEGEEGAAEEVLSFDECLWCTQAAAAAWIRDTGLPTGEP